MKHAKETGVLILGSGLAALTAAIRLKDKGFDVTIVTKKGAGKASNTAFSMGIFNAMGEKLAPEKHIEKTLQTGSYLNDRSLVEAMVSHQGEAFDYIQQKGLSLQGFEKGYRVNAGDRSIPGAAITDGLVAEVKKKDIELLTFHLPLDLLIVDGNCKGALVMNPQGEPLMIQADCVVLATGGFAGAVARNDNPPAMVGEGLILAYRAGAALRDLEFIQYYPLGYYEKSLPQYMVTNPSLDKGKLYNDQGEDLLAKYLGEGITISEAVSEHRDVLAISMEKEWKEQAVWMDLTGQAPGYSGLYNNKFDFNKYPFRVRPVAHFTVGGVCIDTGGRTDVPGLYAAGEVTGGLHGGDRLGGNALTEALTFGYLAAGSIAVDLENESHGTEKSILPARWEDIRIHNPLINKRGVENCQKSSSQEIRNLMKEIKAIFFWGLNPLRNQKNLKTTIEKAKTFQSNMYETELLCLDTYTAEATADLMRLVAEAALMRRESRGGHYREDHPQALNEYADNNTCWHREKLFWKQKKSKGIR